MRPCLRPMTRSASRGSREGLCTTVIRVAPAAAWRSRWQTSAGRRGVERRGRLVGQDQARPAAAAGGRSPPSGARRPKAGRPASSARASRPMACKRRLGAAHFVRRVAPRPAAPAADPRRGCRSARFRAPTAAATRCRPCSTCPTSRRKPRNSLAGSGRGCSRRPEHREPAMAGRQEAGEQAQQGRLAGAVVADHGDALARGNAQLFDFEQGAPAGGAEDASRARCRAPRS